MTDKKPSMTIYDEASTVTPEMWETGIDMPRKIGKHPALAVPYGEKPEPHYERFLCLNGGFEGRGLIVPMPATYVWGYDLLKLKDGTRVAIVKEPMAAPGLTA